MAYIQDINLINSSSTKIVKSYSFDANNKKITIKEDFDSILYIYCLQNNQMIYNPTAKGFGGSILGNSIILDYDVTTYENFYNLLIVVDYKKPDLNDSLLNDILEELQKQTNLLNKIYKHE